jgi:hypothetical protein
MNKALGEKSSPQDRVEQAFEKNWDELGMVRLTPVAGFPHCTWEEKIDEILAVVQAINAATSDVDLSDDSDLSGFSCPEGTAAVETESSNGTEPAVASAPETSPATRRMQAMLAGTQRIEDPSIRQMNRVRNAGRRDR